MPTSRRPTPVPPCSSRSGNASSLKNSVAPLGVARLSGTAVEDPVSRRGFDVQEVGDDAATRGAASEARDRHGAASPLLASTVGGAGCLATVGGPAGLLELGALAQSDLCTGQSFRWQATEQYRVSLQREHLSNAEPVSPHALHAYMMVSPIRNWSAMAYTDGSTVV